MCVLHCHIDSIAKTGTVGKDDAIVIVVHAPVPLHRYSGILDSALDLHFISSVFSLAFKALPGIVLSLHYSPNICKTNYVTLKEKPAQMITSKAITIDSFLSPFL